jgi:AcrR family transcriptional regulator
MEAGARSRRGAPSRGEVSARERILATASDLFHREGIRAIGVSKGRRAIRRVEDQPLSPV